MAVVLLMGTQFCEPFTRVINAILISNFSGAVMTGGWRERMVYKKKFTFRDASTFGLFVHEMD